MRLVRPLLLTLLASAGLAALIVWSTGPGRVHSDSQDAELFLSTLFNAETHSSSDAHELPRVSVPEVPAPSASVDPQLRIALLSQRPLLQVSTQDGAGCHKQGGIPVLPGLLNGMLAKASTGLVSCGGNGGSVLVNGRAYEGTIHLLNRGQGWLAINEINLERYVASVVGAEMPSHWNSEALKAQAVAARSYGLVHMLRPANSDWNLGDTTRWQAYAGRTSSNESTIQATEDTRGLVLSFKGGLVESLYASTQEISDDAHGHLGASMSQHGAQELAQQGLRFNEILGRYYSGASLARIKSDG
ncbi:SpoIID/LytB domain-containing protein [Synechococcus sp. MIT S9508]|uniref:SpoIID/LytB domain-containing protein n=1 Tax=Synechococcus sp. MIT S9508 TaxID=1801629 RepID=UPI0007BC3391|nr:SpoIID/LytB domain-containing protein [Synechococcus sp. MIT S9508]KZR89605.1 Amidase enhancer precursor [Synechococcus sp. MIT S9508]